MSESPKIDRRILRTKSALWGGLYALLRAREWGEINVRLICEKADVARSSFYLHFENKQELLDYGVAQTLNDIRGQMQAKSGQKNQLNSVIWLVDHINGNVQFFAQSRAANSPVFMRFQKEIRDLIGEELIQLGVRLDVFRVDFIVGGIFAVLAAWADAPQNQSVMELTRQINQLVFELLPDQTEPEFG